MEVEFMIVFVRTLILLNLLGKVIKKDKTLNKTLFNVLMTKN